VLARFVVSFPSVEEGFSKPRGYLNGLGVIRDGSILLAFSKINTPPIVVSYSESGKYLDGLGIIRDGLVVLSLYEAGFSPIVIGYGKFRVWFISMALV
jgi:hypothetical protein